MPYMTNGHRDYKKQYAKYDGRPSVIHDRDERNKAHRAAEKYYGHRIHKDVDHIHPLSKGGTNSESNLRVVSEHQNRSFSRNADGSLKRNDGKPK